LQEVAHNWVFFAQPVHVNLAKPSHLGFHLTEQRSD